jgi:osmotically-inducible protein OsmY
MRRNRDSDFGRQSSYRFNDRMSRNENNEQSEDKLRSNYSGKGPKGWKRSLDRLREEVYEVLYMSPRVDASDIEVSIQDNNFVSLRGSVDSRQSKREAENCVERVSGIEDVRNELQVRRPKENLS